MYFKEIELTIRCTPQEYEDLRQFWIHTQDREMDAVVKEIQSGGWPSQRAKKLLGDGWTVADVADELGQPVEKVQSFADSIGYREEDPDGE